VGKARRLKDQRRRSRRGVAGEPMLIDSEEDLLSNPELVCTDMPGRVTYLDDPVFGEMQPAIGVGSDGRIVTDTSSTEEPIPVVLFEPVRIMMGENKVTGLVQELRTEAIVAAGFHRVPSGPVWAAKPAVGWEVRREPGRLVLCDGTGDIWAASEITPDPQWVSAAVSYRHIIVFYGPRLGVRVPPGTDPASYTTAARAAEFRDGRQKGLVSVATVKWQGEASSQTLDWVTFLPGSFGQGLPGIFVPALTFARQGGPAAFGLALVPGEGAEVIPTSLLTARVSRTDIDLMDPAESQRFRWVGGVHYAEGIDTAWARAARRHGLALLVTGPRLPGGDYADKGQLAGAGVSELWAALVSVTFA
jgi:hypothetical protein